MLKNSYISLAKKDYMEKPLFVFYTLLFCKLPLHGHLDSGGAGGGGGRVCCADTFMRRPFN